MATTEATPGTPNTATTAPVKRFIGITYPAIPSNKCTPNSNKIEKPKRNNKIDRPSNKLEVELFNTKNNNNTSEHTIMVNFM